MAYVPPHLRKGHTVTTTRAAKLISTASTGRSGKIVYGDNAIWRWLAVGSKCRETEFQSIALQRVPVEHIENIRGQKPLSLINNGSLNGRDGSWKPWTYIAEEILQDLIHSSKVLRSLTGGEIRPKLAARVGKILYLHRENAAFRGGDNDLVSENTLKQFRKIFYTNVPASYMDNVLNDVVPKIGVQHEDLKDVYHVKLSDESLPESVISCKCRFVKEKNRLELYKVELNQIRHMVYDISCIGKNLDLRLMLSSQRTLTSLTDDEEESITNLISAAILDPNTKGGLRWPLGRASSMGNRYRVVAVWHTISRVYGNPSVRLKVANADRFNFRTSVGEVTGEITLKLKEVTSELLKLDKDSITHKLKDVVKLLWDHFLCA